MWCRSELIQCICILCGRCWSYKINFTSLHGTDNVQIGKLTFFKWEVKLWKTKRKKKKKTRLLLRDFRLPPQCTWGIRSPGMSCSVWVVVYRRFGIPYSSYLPRVTQSKKNDGQRVDSLYRWWCERWLDMGEVGGPIRLSRPGSNFTLHQRGWSLYLPKKPITISYITINRPVARRSSSTAWPLKVGPTGCSETSVN
jgi:hypothetical protein